MNPAICFARVCPKYDTIAARKKLQMSDKKKVYVETTVISDATALPTNDLALAGRQIVTREWWKTASERFELYASPVVRREAMRGDPSAAARRMAELVDIPDIAVTEEAVQLAQALVDAKAVPKAYKEDAMHKAMKMYKNSEVILDDNDFVDLDFKNV